MKFSIDLIRGLQEKTLENILGVSRTQSETKIGGIAACLLPADANLVRAGLGEVGVELYDFVHAIDLDHPDLSAILSGILIRPTTTAKRFAQYINLVRFAQEQALTEILPDIPKMALRSVEKDLRSIIKPYSQYVRFLAKAVQREESRKTKEAKSFDVGFLAKKGNFNWDSIPQDFSMYCHNSASYQEEVERAKKKALRFKDLNCTSLYKEILNNINEFKEEFEKDYYGFRYITVSKSACILAKMHGITYSASPFRLMSNEGGRSYSYWPRIYPFHEFKRHMHFLMPSSIVKLVEHLESFPSANNKPIFDHFLVVVPSLENLKPDQDIQNIQCHSSCPVLLGEADGKCYFICHII